MKKLFISIALILTAFAANAEVVKESAAKLQAGQYAVQALGKTARVADNLMLAGTSNDVARMAPGASLLFMEDPTFYIYNISGGGFVIISGDDCAVKILGSSEKGSIDIADMPANMVWWLNGMGSEISSARKDGLGRNPDWDNADASSNPIVEYETAQWDQGDPYNQYCPYYTSNKRTVTGCVATAAAIVCRFHQWPESGVGTVPAYTTYTRRLKVEAHELGAKYDYSLMPLTYKKGSYTQQQGEAVAHLMYDLGTSVQMDYAEASGAYTHDLVASLKKYFRYKNTAELRYKYNYRQESEWVKMLQEDMKKNGPIIYGGVDPSPNGGGHQFVFDGCREDGYFRVNWGWSGSGNGYFSVSALGGSSTGYTFSQQQDAVFNLEPDKFIDRVGFKYSRVTKTITLDFGTALSYSFEGPDGVVSQGYASAGESVEISVNRCASGSYKLVISRSNTKYELPVEL